MLSDSRLRCFSVTTKTATNDVRVVSCTYIIRQIGMYIEITHMVILYIRGWV